MIYIYHIFLYSDIIRFGTKYTGYGIQHCERLHWTYEYFFLTLVSFSSGALESYIAQKRSNELLNIIKNIINITY